MTFQAQMDFTNHNNQFMRHCGIWITCLEEGCCRAEPHVEDYCRPSEILPATEHGVLTHPVKFGLRPSEVRPRRVKSILWMGEIAHSGGDDVSDSNTHIHPQRIVGRYSAMFTETCGEFVLPASGGLRASRPTKAGERTRTIP